MSDSFSLKRLFPIASDPIIIMLIVMIIGLTFFAIQMVNNDVNNPYTNSTKIITRWTEIPGDGYENCTQYGSGWGGNGPNSSTWGHCYNCSCINVQEINL